MMTRRSLQKPEGFAVLGLGEATLAALADMGFEKPSPIQERTIPLLLEGKDLIGQARTGTGKTAAFGLPILERMDAKSKALQAMVLCPTRELASQVASELERMSKYMDVGVLPVYGGADMDKQVKALRGGVQIVVGTPGRVMDHMRRGNLHAGGLDFLVLDEADRMLDMGFIEDIEWILTQIPPRGRRQMMLFSATMPQEVMDIAQRFMMEPQTVAVSTDQLTVPQVEQVYHSVGRRNKLWALSRILEYEQPTRMIVFCATKRMVDILTEQLKRHNYPSEAIHGDMTQSRRERMLKHFKEGDVHILVATDVAARGLDINDVTHVVNYDLPEEPEVYIHRIGRTARMGRKGKAITFISKGDKSQLRLVQQVVGSEITLSPVPGEEAGEEEAPAQVPRKGRGGPKKDKIRKVVDWEHIADRYGNVHLQIDVGKKDGGSMVSVHKFVREIARVPEYAVGHVRVLEDHSLFDLPKEEVEAFLRNVKGRKWKGRPVEVDVIEQE
jgi:ATP-dependent RNA helicase DeaD